MKDDKGGLSIDLIVGYTIFLIAFIWVISLIPGLLIGLQAYTIDYNAVAYRTGVILVEDPGETSIIDKSHPWESLDLPSQVARFGLTTSKDTPNILSEKKIASFFDTQKFTATDYRQKAIFGDYPYNFNISLRDFNGNEIYSTGDVLPEKAGYGYIRRLAKIRSPSNATINEDIIVKYGYVNDDPDKINTTRHTFSILIDTSELYRNVTDPAYRIDPTRDQIMINITDLNSTMFDDQQRMDQEAELISIQIINNNQVFDAQTLDTTISLDGQISPLPQIVNDNISITLQPSVFQRLYEGIYDPVLYKPVYVNLSFDLKNRWGGPANGTFLNNTWSPESRPFDYNYNITDVTQPQLRDAVLEVAISPGGGGMPGWGTGGTYTISSSAGSHGGISPVGETTVYYGDTPTYTITPATGYSVYEVKVNGISKGSVTSYTFPPVHENQEITATFTDATYSIKASAGANGTISPAGITTVSFGGSQTYTITNETGYYILDVAVDSISKGSVTSYTFTSVHEKHEIYARFAKLTPLTEVSITGTPQVGSTLTVNLTPPSATATYQWQYGPSGGPYTAITGATSRTYTPVEGDINSFIRVVATGTGGYSETRTSDPVGPVTPIPLTGVSIAGTPLVNSTVAAILEPSGANVTYKWQISETRDGTYADISGATNSTYKPVAGDIDYFLKVIATGTGSYGGTVNSTGVGPVLRLPLTGVSIDGTPALIGNDLTAEVVPSGATATYQWQESSSGSDPWTDIGLGYSYFTPDAGNFNNYIRVVATGSGSYGGTATSDPVGPVKDHLDGVSISGNTTVGYLLTALVAPTEANTGGNATLQWQRSLYGTYTDISGATSSTYTTVEADLCSYIRVIATGSGTYYGGTVTSAQVGVITTPLTDASIGGELKVNRLLTASVTPPGALLTSAYQWKRCTSSSDIGTCTDISGATSSTYTTVEDDKQNYIRVMATGSNCYTGTVTSPAVGKVVAEALHALATIKAPAPENLRDHHDFFYNITETFLTTVRLTWT